NRRPAILTAVLSGEKEMSPGAVRNRAAKRCAHLAQRISDNLVAAGRCSRRESGEPCCRVVRPPQTQEVAIITVCSRIGNDVHHAVRGSAVLCRKSIFQHRHFLHSRQRDIAENRLPPPAIVPRAPVYYPGCLAAA